MKVISTGVNLIMGLIRNIVQHALATGYLTLESEEQLRLLLQRTKYGVEDFEAFIALQREVIEGRVKQEAQELLRSKILSAAVYT